MAGDHNCNLLSTETNITTKKRKDLMHNYQLKQHITAPIIITKMDDTKNIDSGVIHLGISDHSLVYICRKIAYQKETPKLIETRQFKHFNALRFQSELSEAFSSFSTSNDPNKAWEI